MSAWLEFIVGTLEVSPEIQVFVNLVGATLFLEVVTLAFNLIGSFKGYR